MSFHHSDQMSLGSLCSVVKSLIVNSVRPRYQARDKVTYRLSCQWTLDTGQLKIIPHDLFQVRLLKKCKFLIEKDHSEKEMAVQVHLFH